MTRREERGREREEGWHEEEGALDPVLAAPRDRRPEQGADQPADDGGRADRDTL